MLSLTSSTHGEIDGCPVQLFTLTNNNGMTVQVSELGALLISVQIPGSDNQPRELTLGYDSFEGWRDNSYYLGATVGRFGNRIKGGKFTLDGKEHLLATNNFPNDIPCHLHGGPHGFHTKIWKGTPVSEGDMQGVRLTLTSPDGDENYPGTLDATVTYWLTDENELRWIADATTDQPTPVNIINHAYWNLSGDLDQSIADHTIQISSSHFLPKDDGLIPTGELHPVAGTPMDLNSPKPIGDGLTSDYETIVSSLGYDHHWVLEQSTDGSPRPAAIASHPSTGITLEVHTDQPGIQFYTGNFLDGACSGRNGKSFPVQSGFCLETQAYPDAPNQAHFPSCILRPGENYHHELLLKLKWEI